MAELRIAHYQVVRRLGQGGMGEVLLAKDTKLDRLVAIKLMSVDLASRPKARQRFSAEAKAASGLNHPNICVIHEVGETERGRPYLAMEYVAGQTLEAIIQTRRVKIREVIDIGIQTAEALEAAHARHIVHRDVKTGNIMLSKKGQVKVLDFGLAKRFAFEESTSDTKVLSHTDTGMLIGTPHYMSPEQMLGRDLDQRSDIFSLGVVLYEATTGQKPFRGKNVGETINSIVNHSPPPLGLKNPVYSPALENIIFKCLQKEPAQRYSSARAVSEDLAKLKAEAEHAKNASQTLAAEEFAAAPPSSPAGPTRLSSRRSKHQRLAVVAATVMLLAVLGSWVLLSQSRDNARAAEPEIVGTPVFSNQVYQAMLLLKTSDAEAYAIVTNFVGLIKQGERSGMWAYKVPPTYEMSDLTALHSVTWCAATIAHDSFHSRLYHEYRKAHGGDVPADAWTGTEAERKCMTHQLAVMERIGAPKSEIDHAKKQADGHYVKDKETWEDYKKRTW